MYTTIHNVTTPRGIRAYIYTRLFYNTHIASTYVSTIAQVIHSKCILLASADVCFSGIDFQCSSQHVHNVNHTAQVYNALYTYCGRYTGFQSRDVQSTQSIYSLYSLY